MTDNILQTNYKYTEKDNKIRSMINPRYCVTANKKKDTDEYNLFLQLCANNNPLQQFTYTDQKQIISKNLQTELGESYCVNANFNDTTNMKLCENPIPTRQRWKLETQTQNYCIKKGMYVLVLQKEPRKKKTIGSFTPFNPPIDNLLSEHFDNKYFHYWVTGIVDDIKDGKFIITLIYHNNIDNPNDSIKKSIKLSVTSDKIVPDLDLTYQLNEAPRKGDVVLVKHRGLYIDRYNKHIEEKYIYWKGVIIGNVPNANNLYKVALSVNSIEPNLNNELKGRDLQTSVKQISIDNMRFLRRANVCKSSIEL